MMERERKREMAERIRKAAKELMWAGQNLAKVYEMIRPVDMPPMEDPNQLKMFDDEC